MPNKIEIYERTLLKLLVRRGADSERQLVTLTDGELGYASDTKRLYIGDGETAGGNIVGNKVHPSTAAVTSLTNVVSGDLAYDNDNKKLYRFTGGSVLTQSNWEEVGGVYTAADGTVSISSTNGISVSAIGAGNVSAGALGNSLELDSSNRIALSSDRIRTNAIRTWNATYLELPQKLKINSTNYTWPAGGTETNTFLKTDIAGNLSWSTPMVNNSTVFVASTAGQIPVGSIMPFVSAANAPSGWLLCNGQSVAGASYPELSAVIGTTYGGNSNNFNVPDFTNKTLYGVTSTPANSTIYQYGSSGFMSLSAAGALFIIKAKPDIIISSYITVKSPLTCYQNGANVTGSSITTLSGILSVGMGVVGTAATVNSVFGTDAYGRVTSINSATNVLVAAGTQSTVSPTSTPVWNAASPITFLKTPVDIFKKGAKVSYDANGTSVSVAASDMTFTSFSQTITAYPRITTLDPLSGSRVVTSYNVPAHAKNLIVECIMRKEKPDSGYDDRFVCAAPSKELLSTSGRNASTVEWGPFPPDGPGATEYLVGSIRSSGEGDDVRSSNTVFLPLSSTALGHLTMAFRINRSSNDSVHLRVVGYTI